VIIEAVQVKNFRSIRDERLNCANLTALVGPNGSGKSAFLSAISLFYSTSEKVSADDYFAGDTKEPISIAITYGRLNNEATEMFGDRVERGALTIEKVIEWNDGQPKASYHGTTLQNPGFLVLRNAFEITDRGMSAKQHLKELRDSGDYDSLPEWSTKSGTMQALTAWEQEHPESCERMRDNGQFFGFKQVGEGYIGRFTRCLEIPAVRDAHSDAAEGRGSVLTGLMDLVVRKTVANRKELVELQSSMQEQYERLMSPEYITELSDLESQLSSTLATFVPDAEVKLKWESVEQLEFPMPRANMRLVEDGYPSPVDKSGHGLQRAFIMTMLQHLAIARVEDEAVSESESASELSDHGSLPSLVLLIEEPELYQHPNRQRYFAQILDELATGRTPGVADQTQIIYSTHSPHFVGIDRIDRLRLIKKVQVHDNKPKESKVIETQLDTVADRIWRATGCVGDRFTGESLLPRLRTLMTPWMNEGFFADLVVLVEGDDDRTALVGTAQAMGYDLTAMGISVIPCGGKTNLDRPAAIFKELGIRIYVVWDSDRGLEGAKAEHNHILLRLLNVQDLLDWPSAIEHEYACFETNLEDALRQDIGEDIYESVLLDCQQRYAIPKKKHAMKNPHVVSELIEIAKNRHNRECHTLKQIVKRIVENREQQTKSDAD
jgi:putative ATP-dependent endonuclease of the OLD family